jgi:hypothetical protein
MTTATTVDRDRRRPRPTGRLKGCSLCGRPGSFLGTVATDAGEVTAFRLCGVCAALDDDELGRRLARWIEQYLAGGGVE